MKGFCMLLVALISSAHSTTGRTVWTSLLPGWEDPATFFAPLPAPKLALLDEARAQVLDKSTSLGMGVWPAQGLLSLEVFVLDDGDPLTVSEDPVFAAELNGWSQATGIAIGRDLWCISSPSVLIAALFHEAAHLDQDMPAAPPPAPQPPLVEPAHLALQRKVVDAYRHWKKATLETDAFALEKEFIDRMHGANCFPDTDYCRYVLTRDNDLLAYKGAMNEAVIMAKLAYANPGVATPNGERPLDGYAEAVMAMGLSATTMSDDDPVAIESSRMIDLSIMLASCASSVCPGNTDLPLFWN